MKENEITGPLKILLVEDAEEDVLLIERVISQADLAFTSLVVKAKESFEGALKEFAPDVILCDHSLPSFNSIEAFSIFRQWQAETEKLIPFILVTGNVSEEFAIQMLKAGVDDYILKSTLKRLPSAIESALEKCRMENERLKFHRRLVRMEALMREGEHLAHIGSWEADLLTGTYTWSDETYLMYGYQPGEVEPTYDLWLSFVHPDDVAWLKEAQANATDYLDSDEYEFRIIDKGGKIRHIFCRLNIKRNAEGRAIRITGFNIDSTERVQAQHSLRVNEQIYRSLFEGSPDAIFSLDLEGRFTNANEAFASLVGLTVDTIRGMDFRAILCATEFERVYHSFESATGRKPERYQTNFTDRSGQTLLLDVTVMPIIVDEVMIGVHCIAKDLTRNVRVSDGSTVTRPPDPG
jgi:PAS domain S-box-containing protein